MKSVETAAIYEVGNVKKVYGDYILIALLYSFYCDSDCEHCKEVCKETTKIMRIKNTVSAKEGERIVIGMSNRSAYYHSILFTASPCFLFISLFLFTQIFVSSLIFLLIGIFVFILCFFYLRIIDKILEKTGKYKISIIKILNSSRKNGKIDR